MVVGNHLAQHRELSLTAIGLATHIFSVPEGTPVDIRSLTERFPEGRDRIAFALRELEAHGYLRRVREHTEDGRLATRTYAHHTPVDAASAASAAVVEPARSVVRRSAAGRARTRHTVEAVGDETPQEDDQAVAEPVVPAGPTAPTSRVAPSLVEPGPTVPDLTVPEMPPHAAPRSGPLHEKAVALLAGLRRADERLTLSLREVHRLAPAVVDWLERGVGPVALRHTLTADLPVVMKHPAGVLAYRLRELLPPPLPAAPEPPPPTAGAHRPHPLQDCDGCERVFRAPEPGRCRDCRHEQATGDRAVYAA
ncbi:helix-turn-helix domain-containing protein [Streptomyces pseudogriseolus]|uniref:helix-turn-helix domain-containing protein n=1 Tax=Streptomyces pseudogriseolus TaxID=36817 RepID=UPI001CE3899C|nr:helix-turn-helix domain-containing protein [Streptomyces pseudogriseolus]